jgi:hypothetical protein
MNQSLIKRLVYLTSLTVILTFTFQSTQAQAKANKDSLILENTISEFLISFNNLDTTKFDTFFDESVIVFFPPSVKYPYKVTGKTEVLRKFHSLFSNIRSTNAGPPFLKLDPQKKDVRLEGHIAIVTFELKDPTLLGRRTLIFKRIGQKWKIIHLHASGNTYQ